MAKSVIRRLELSAMRQAANLALFKNQLFVSEQTHSKVHRVFLEKVNGFYQGAVFPFLEGFGSGNIVARFAKDGSMFTGRVPIVDGVQEEKALSLFNG